MAFWNQLISGLGQQNAPFGFDAQPVAGNPMQDDPAYRSGMQMLGNIGMGMLASGERNPMRALGRSYLVAQQNAQDQNKNQYIAAQMMQDAEYKKQERQRAEEERQQREAFLKTLPPDVQMKARSIPGYLDSYIEATDPNLQSAMNPGDRYKAVGGNIYDVATGQWITSPNGGQGDLPKGYRWKADGSGAEPIPGVSLPGTQMRLTEQQSKDLVYLQRGEAALVNLDKNEKALTGFTDNAADYLPGGNYLTSEEYQVASQAGREFLAAVLRKDTGAAITAQEMSIYGKMYLPQPGDSDTVLNQKRAARRVALDAIKNGLGAAQAALPPTVQEPAGDAPEGVDASVWEVMTPEERALWQ